MVKFIAEEPEETNDLNHEKIVTTYRLLLLIKNNLVKIGSSQMVDPL